MNIEVRRNPFIQKNPERLSPLQVKELFACPPGFDTYDDVSKHQVIIGSKGSGKSILLKTLSVQTQSLIGEKKKLDYYGIYIPRIIPLYKFVDLYEKFEMEEVFQHFFATLIISEIASQLSEVVSPDVHDKITRFIVDRFIKKLKSPNSFEDNLSEGGEFKLGHIVQFLRGTLQDIINNLDKGPDLVPKDFGFLYFWKFDSLVQFLCDLHHELNPFPIFCLLIDGFEDFGELGISVLNSFFRHENLGFLCVKVATRKFNFNIEDIQRELKIEYERDYDIVILDCDPNDENHISKFLRVLANQKLKTEWNLSDDDLNIINIDSLLSTSKPGNISWDYAKTPAENFKDNNIIARDDKLEKRKLRQKCFSGFECIAKISMVNPYEFLEICEIAFREQEKIDNTKIAVDIPVPTISSEAQYAAITKKSRRYKSVGITSKKDYSDYFLGIRSFICNTARHLEANQSPGQFEGVRILLQLRKLSESHINVIRDGILNRDLFVPVRENLIHLLVNPTLLPIEIELNRLICPIYGLSWECRGNFCLSQREVDRFIKTQLSDDIDFVPHRRGTMINEHQQTLLEPSIPTTVFISTKYLDASRRRLAKRKRSINLIKEEEIKQTGRLSSKISYCTDLWDLRAKYGGSYKYYILEEIKKSLYILVDITTGVSTGIAYEVGVAIGLKIPFFLFFDAEDTNKSFDPTVKQQWHPFLKEQDIREWERGWKFRTFKEWYQINIDRIGRGVTGKLDCVLKGFLPDRKCELKNLITKGVDKPYVSFQTQNTKARDIVIQILSEKYGCYPISENDIPSVDPLCFKCAAIQASKFQIIDVSSIKKDEKGYPPSAIELGVAYALHPDKVLMVFNADIQNDPVEMYPGAFTAWHEVTIQKNLEEGIDNFMKKLGYGGMKK